MNPSLSIDAIVVEKYKSRVRFLMLLMPSEGKSAPSSPLRGLGDAALAHRGRTWIRVSDAHPLNMQAGSSVRPPTGQAA